MKALGLKLWEKSLNIYHCGRRRRRVQSEGGRKLMVNHTVGPPEEGPPELRSYEIEIALIELLSRWCYINLHEP